MIVKPKTWLRYVDIFLVWADGTEKLNDFLKHINSIHPGIQLTMEVETDLFHFHLSVAAVKTKNSFYLFNSKKNNKNFEC